VPNHSIAYKSNSTRVLGAGHRLTLLYGETLSVRCVDNHRIGAADIRCAFRFDVECRDDGELGYTDYSIQSALVGPSDQSCVPIRCNVSEIKAVNGVVSAANESVSVGGEAVIQCSPGFSVKPQGYQGRNPLSSHPSNFSRTCQADTCAFNSGPICLQSGCKGRPSYTTTDGLVIVSSFSAEMTNATTGRTQRQAIDPAEDGLLSIGQSMKVTCPVGYRAGPAPHQHTSAPTSRVALCTQNHEIDAVNCSRVTCGHYTVPQRSIGVRGGGAPRAAGTVLRYILYGETVRVSCDLNHRLGALDTTCQQRAFEIGCGDDGEFFYLGNTTSSLSPHLMTCDPIRCSMPMIANSQRSPVSGTVRWGEAVSVSCNAGFYASPGNYSGKHALCNHATSVSLVCDNSTCDFPFTPSCRQPGCYGIVSYKSTGALTALRAPPLPNIPLHPHHHAQPAQLHTHTPHAHLRPHAFRRGAYAETHNS